MQPESTFPVGSDGSVGAILQRAREERGLSVTEVAQVTRIRPRYLEALENDASEDDFPGRVYARFFLREYARYLRVPDQPLVEALDARWTAGPPEEEALAPVLALSPVREPRRWVGRVVTLSAVAALVTLVAISALSGGSSPPTRSTGATSAAPRTPATTSTGGAAGGGPAIPPGGGAEQAPPSRVTSITARLTATGRCWVYATAADGRTLFSQTLEPGQSTTLRARRGIDLRLGNASGVTLKVNGERVPVGQGVQELSFALKNGKLVTS